MRWLILLLLFSSYTYSQVFVQTFTDRCTGEAKTIVIPFEGSTVVAFYNQSRVFTINDVRSGELQVWLEEVYAWWRTISPCSTNQATTTATQTTTSNATQNATAAASSAASPPPQTGGTTSSSTSTETSSSSTGEQATGSGESDSGSGTDSEASSSEESSSEESSSEETSEEESSEGESEDDGEDSDDGEESEEEDSKSKQKANPIIVAANVATMSALDGTVSLVSNVGLSQASLNGITSYSLNAMIWDNLKQFNVNIGRSYTNKEQLIILNRPTKNVIMGGNIKNISTTSINMMYSFGMFNIALGKSKVYLLPKNTIAGWATNFMVMSADKNFSFIPTGIGFATKPYTFNRHVVSPMAAVALTPVMFNTVDNSFLFNKNAMFVLGASDSFNLTRNFYANLGFNIVESTANLPMTWAITIGSRFQF